MSNIIQDKVILKNQRYTFVTRNGIIRANFNYIYNKQIFLRYSITPFSLKYGTLQCV